MVDCSIGLDHGGLKGWRVVWHLHGASVKKPEEHGGMTIIGCVSSPLPACA